MDDAARELRVSTQPTHVSNS